MTSFAKFLAMQLVREWRQRQRARIEGQDAADHERDIPEGGASTSWRARFHAGQRVWLNQVDMRVKEVRADGIVLRHARRAGAANYFFNEREVTALTDEGRLRPFEESRS